MIQKIVEAKGITENIWLVKLSPNFQKTWGQDRYGHEPTNLYIPVKGYHRVLAADRIQTNWNDYEKEVVENTKNLSAIVFEDVPREQAEDAVLDHDSVNLLLPSELILTIERLWGHGHNLFDIMAKMGVSLINAGLIKRPPKADLDDFEKEVKYKHRGDYTKEAKSFMNKKFRSFIGSYICKALEMGGPIFDQVKWHWFLKDGISLPEGATVCFEAKREAIAVTLSQAMAKDRQTFPCQCGHKEETGKEGIKVTCSKCGRNLNKSQWEGGIKKLEIAGKGEEKNLYVEGGGPATRKALKELYEAMHKPKTEVAIKRMITKGESQKMAGSYTSELGQALFKLHQGENVNALEAEKRAESREEIQQIAERFLATKVPEPFKGLCKALADCKPVNFESVLFKALGKEIQEQYEEAKLQERKQKQAEAALNN
jgi:hypothetical protein